MFENSQCNDEYRIDVEKKKLRNIDFETALSYTGFGKYNFALILVCGLTLLGVNHECYAVGYVLPSAECDLDLNTYTKGILTSTHFIGIMGSCCIWGYLADTKGRKKVLVFSLILAFISSVIASFTPSFWGFAILRFFNGVFISAPSAVIFAYFGEFQSKGNRSKAMACISLFIAIALIDLPGLAWLLISNNIQLEFFGFSYNSWRLFMFLISIPSVVAALAFTRFPESPKFLYHVGKRSEALHVMKKMYAMNTGKSGDDFPVESLQEKISLKGKSKNIARDFLDQISPLFAPPHLKYTLAACLMQGGVFAISSGVYLWYSDIINQLSIAKDNSTSMTVCSAFSLSTEIKTEDSKCIETVDEKMFIQNLIIGFIYLGGYAAWGLIVNLLGNRNFFVLCMVISVIASLLIHFITEIFLIDILFVAFLTLPGICISVISASVVDIMPTYLCGMAVCITMTAGRFGSVVSSSVVGLMLEWDCTITFVLYGLNLIACLLLAFVFPNKSKS